MDRVILKIKLMKSFYHVIFFIFFILTLPGNQYFDETGMHIKTVSNKYNKRLG